MLTHREFLQWSIDELASYADSFCFEITETAIIDDPEEALSNIKMLQEAGIELSIDDYGSGLSSLSYLKQIPAQELKIDKCFVQDLTQNSDDALLIKSTIDLAHSLGMSVTVEGVETNEALAVLAGFGTDKAQGYYISKPKTLLDIIAFLEERGGSLGNEKNVRASGATS